MAYELVVPAAQHLVDQGTQFVQPEVNRICKALKAHDQRLDLVWSHKLNLYLVYYTQRSGIQERVLVWENPNGTPRELSMGIIEAIKRMDREHHSATWEQVEANRQKAIKRAEAYSDAATKETAERMLHHIKSTRPDLIHQPRVSMAGVFDKAKRLWLPGQGGS